MFWQLGPIWLLIFFLQASVAIESNRTIDDTIGDSVTGRIPTYLPSAGVWEKTDCTGCVLQPDRVMAFNGTWTTATYDPNLKSMSAELAFKGTAIYIFFILANIVQQGLPTETACNFTLDGQPAGGFTHVPTPTNEFLYNSLVFSQRNLPNVDHQLSISTSDLDRRVWVNFDYAIYTADDAPPLLSSSASSPSSIPPQSSTLTTFPVSSALPRSSERVDPSQIGAIAGGIIGVFFSLATLLSLFVLCRRRKRIAEQDDGEFPTVVPPILAGHQYNDSNARIITPFVNPYIGRPESQFVQNGASIYSPITQPGTPLPTNGFPMVPISTYSSDTTHQPMDQNTILALPGSQAMSAGTGTTSGPNPILLTPLGTGVYSPQDHLREVVQRERQMELGRQMRAVRQDMRDLTTDFHVVTTRRRATVASGARGEEVEVLNLREQIRVMKEQIEYLQAQQRSPWARGLSDEPPPGYSTRHSSVRR